MSESVLPVTPPSLANAYVSQLEVIGAILDRLPGFALVPVEVPSRDVTLDLAAWFALQPGCQVYRVADERNWSELAATIVEAPSSPKGDWGVEPRKGLVVVIAPDEMTSDLRVGLTILNQKRDRVAEALGIPLLWCGTREFLRTTAELAPDFWSHRELPLRIDIPTELKAMRDAATPSGHGPTTASLASDKRITSRSPIHIVLLADDSNSMSGPAATAATEAIHLWVNELQVAARGKMPYFRFSLVTFGSTATIVGDGQNNLRAENLNVVDVDIAGFRLEGTSGGTNLAAAFRVATEILLRDGATPAYCPPFVLLFTDGNPTNDQGQASSQAAEAALEEAARLKQLQLPCGSPVLVVLGFGEVDDELLKNVASKPTFYHRLPNAPALIKMLPAIGTPTIDARSSIRTFLNQVEHEPGEAA